MSRLRTTLPLAFFLVLPLTAPALAAPGDPAVEAGSEPRSDSYREGQRAIDNRDWDAASRIFGKIASGSGGETDAALYWKAYADWKQNRKKESLEGLRRLLSAYPDSAWADDAKAHPPTLAVGRTRESRV